MAEILTDKNILPKSPTELQKVGLAFFILFSLARACVRSDIAPYNFPTKLEIIKHIIPAKVKIGH